MTQPRHGVTASPHATQTYQVRGVSRPGGHGVIRCNATDVKTDTGSISAGFRPGPAELLCASLAACLLKNIERFSEMLSFEYEVATAEVEAVRQDSPPRMTGLHYAVEIVTDEPAHRVELMHRNIRKFGTITNTLAGACEVTGTLTVRRPRTRAAGQGDVSDVAPDPGDQPDLIEAPPPAQ